MKKCFALLLLVAATACFAQKQENLKLNWPEEYKWKIATNQEDGQVHFVEVIPGKETLEKWTMLGTMMSLKNVKLTTTAEIVGIYKNASMSESPDAVLTILESDDKAKNIWVVFKVETPKFPNDPVPESQLYYVIQGEETLYVNFIAIKEKTLGKTFIDKWTKVFKASEFVYM